MKDLTSYVFSFEELIRGNFLYVDKTEYIWSLIRPSSGGSRPPADKGGYRGKEGEKGKKAPAPAKAPEKTAKPVRKAGWAKPKPKKNARKSK